MAFEIGQTPGRLETVLGADALAGLVQMSVDSVLGDVQFASDLLGAPMTIDQAQTLPLARRELSKALRSCHSLAHKVKV